MSYNLFRLFFSVLLLVPPSHNWYSEFLMKSIVAMTKFIQTQEFLMFYCDTCKDEHIDRFVGKMHRTVGIPQYVTTNFTSYQLRYLTKRNYMAIVFTRTIDDPIFKVHDKTLLGWHYYMGLIVLLDPVDDLKTIESLLFYLYKRRFTNTHVYFASSNATENYYGFRTYPHFEVSNRKGLILDMKRWAEYLTVGVGGHPFLTPLRADIPRVFKFHSHAHRTGIQGTSYRIFKSFIQYMKGTIQEYPMNSSTTAVNMKQVIELIKDDKIEMSAHAYALYHKTEIDQSYPLLVVQWCIMVPSFNLITNYLYPIKPFEWRVWAMYFAAIICFIVLLHSYERLLVGKRNPIGAVLVGICLMLNITAPRTFKNPTNWEFFLLAIMLLHTAVVTYFYTSFLGSILTVNLFRQQINTIDDLIAANIQVMMIDYEYEFLKDVAELLPEFERLIFTVDPDTLAQHRDAMNNTYAYLITDDRWHFIALQQKYLKQPKFRLSDICFGSFHMGFPMQIDSPVWRDLEYFVYRIHSSGLYQHYEAIAFDYSVQGGYTQRFTSPNEYKSAGMQHLLVAFQVLGTFWAVSLVVFIVEVMFNRRNKKVMGRS